MSIFHKNPFADPTEGLNKQVNPYVEKLLSGRVNRKLPLVYGPELESYRGTWRNRFYSSPKNLILEIGCHTGEFLNSAAKQNPHTGFVGLDITYKRTVITAEKACIAENMNVISALADAQYVNQLFGPKEISGIIIFFPDPWTKKRRQKKNRLMDRKFCAKLAEILDPSGFVWIKTDEPEYFAETSRFLAQEGFHHSGEKTPEPLMGEYAKTSFEGHFTSLRLPTFSGLWVKTFKAIP